MNISTSVLRPKFACSTLGISISTFWRLVAAGKIKTVKLSPRCTGVLKADLEAYIASISQ